MKISDHFDELSKALATSVTRRAAFVRAAKLLGGLVFGTLGLRSSFLHGAPPKETLAEAPKETLVETLKDKTFNCVSTKGATLVQGVYDVCLHRVDCVSTRQGVLPRPYVTVCKAVNGKCPKFEVCGDPTRQKHNPVGFRDARLAEVGPDDRRPTDRYGRKCRYDHTSPIALYFNTEKELMAFCGTPIVCTGGDADAPDRPFAVCEATDGIKEEGQTLPTLICPRVNFCINHPIKSIKAEEIDADQ